MIRAPMRVVPGGMLAAVLLVVGAVGWSAALFGNARAVAQSPTVQITDTSAGSILAGSNGKSLYVFDRDEQGKSNCTGGCAQTWPPLTVESGNPTPPSGLSGTLSVITRDDGSRQVAYNGRPLYFYAPDAQPGDTKGDGVGGVWHLARPLAATTSTSGGAASAGTAAGGLPRAGAALPADVTPIAAWTLGGLVLAVLMLGVGVPLVSRRARRTPRGRR